jgi:hypothetical protein
MRPLRQIVHATLLARIASAQSTWQEPQLRLQGAPQQGTIYPPVFLYLTLFLQVFVCEDCGYTDDHFDIYVAHLRLNHPFSAALLKLNPPSDKQTRRTSEAPDDISK